MKRDKFDASDLVKIDPPAYPVVMKTGGPPLELVCVEGDNALVRLLPQWADDGRGWTVLLPVACLYACVPLADRPKTNPLPAAAEE